MTVKEMAAARAEPEATVAVTWVGVMAAMVAAAATLMRRRRRRW